MNKQEKEKILNQICQDPRFADTAELLCLQRLLIEKGIINFVEFKAELENSMKALMFGTLKAIEEKNPAGLKEGIDSYLVGGYTGLGEN